MDQSKIAFVAIQAALHAGEVLRAGFGTQFEIFYKPGAHNLVTQYDHAAEKIIIDTVRDHFPDHCFLAEESGAIANESCVTWVIDPLDGTTNFAQNIPWFSVSIAVVIDNDVKVGIVYSPMSHELFVGEKGLGVFLNGKKVHVSSRQQIAQGIGATGFPYQGEEDQNEWMKQFAAIRSLGNPLRELGSAALTLAYIAAGRLDFYWIASLEPWDMAAGKLLVEQAGGRVSHYNGSPLQLIPESNLLATNGILHPEMLSYLR